MLQLHSNPGDYAWGQGGLDAVITEVSGVSVVISKNLASLFVVMCFFSYSTLGTYLFVYTLFMH